LVDLVLDQADVLADQADLFGHFVVRGGRCEAKRLPTPGFSLRGC
jgi:hypothetical protein